MYISIERRVQVSMKIFFQILMLSLDLEVAQALSTLLDFGAVVMRPI